MNAKYQVSDKWSDWICVAQSHIWRKLPDIMRSRSRKYGRCNHPGNYHYPEIVFREIRKTKGSLIVYVENVSYSIETEMLTLILNFFLICVRKKPKYIPIEMVKATAKYRKQRRLVMMKAMKLRRELRARMQYTVPCKITPRVSRFLSKRKVYVQAEQVPTSPSSVSKTNDFSQLQKFTWRKQEPKPPRLMFFPNL